MKKLFLLGVLALISATALMAQDLMTKKDGTKIQAIVEEVGVEEVRYRLFAEPAGPVYVVRKADLLEIVFQSGRREIFNVPGENDPGKSEAVRYVSGKSEAVMSVPGNFEYGMSAAQVPDPSRRMTYKELRKMYSARDYVPSANDRYSVAGCGIASFFIPGLGECLCNEFGYGLAKFFSCGALVTVGCVLAAKSGRDAVELGEDPELGPAYACLGVAACIDIWSIVDAVTIARLNNMHAQEQRRISTLDVDLGPSLQTLPLHSGAVPAVGMTLALRF